MSQKPTIVSNEASMAEEKGLPIAMVETSKKKEEAPSTTSTDRMQMLPDEIILLIGTAVAKLCDLQDYVFFALASKRHKKLLMDSDESISSVISIRMLSRIDNLSNALLPQHSPVPIRIHSLEQLGLLEAVAEHNLLYENRVRFDEATIRIESFAVLCAAEAILRRFSNAKLVVDAHSNRFDVPAISFFYAERVHRYILWELEPERQRQEAEEEGEEVEQEEGEEEEGKGEEAEEDDDRDGEDDLVNLAANYIIGTMETVDENNRFFLRAWEFLLRVLTTVSPHPPHPYLESSRSDACWVEVYLRLEDNDGSNNHHDANPRWNAGGTVLELPPRPEYYFSTLHVVREG